MDDQQAKDQQGIDEAVNLHHPSHGLQMPPMPMEAKQWIKNLSPTAFENYQQMEKVWNHPISKLSVTLMRDPAFTGAVNDFSKNFNKNEFLGAEIVWILIIWTLRAWRLSKTGTWLTRIWVQLWVSSLFWWGSLLFIPWLLCGKSFQMILATVFRAMIYQFWT